jgi:hypothetical protein
MRNAGNLASKCELRELSQLVSFWAGKNSETGQCKGNVPDGGSDNPVYRLLSSQPSRSNRTVKTRLLPASIYPRSCHSLFEYQGRRKASHSTVWQ